MSEEKNAQVRKFLDVTGLCRLPEITAEGMAFDFRSSFGASDEEVPEHFKPIVESFKKAFFDARGSLLNVIVDAYAAKFSDEEIASMISFFDSPAGKKIVEAGGIMLPELLGICNEWSAEVMKGKQDEFATLIDAASSAALPPVETAPTAPSP